MRLPFGSAPRLTPRLLLALGLTGLAATPAGLASPATQDPPAAVIHLPLTMADADRAALDPGQIAPPATPTTPATAPPPTLTPTEAPSATATVQPTPTTKPVEIDGDWVRTEHYALLSPSPRVDKLELGRMMEQFYTQATAYFGAEPSGIGAGEERLVGKIYANQASYQAGLRADGVRGGGDDAGGYFDPGTGTFYLFVQPSRHYTRMLTLHEATHQLQRLAVDCDDPDWWAEGEAEHLGMHTWDGETLQLARQPLISLEDHPLSALETFESKGRDISYIVRDQEGWSYREAWAVVSFLRAERPREAAALRGRYCAGEPSEAAWRAVFGGPVTAAINQQYEAWLRANQQPWDWVWNAFEPWGPRGFHGQAADTNALAVTKERPEALEVEIEHLSGNLRASLVVAYHGTQDFVMLRLYTDRILEFIRVTEGFRWEVLARIPAPDARPGTFDRMSARVVDGRLVLAMNGEEVLALDAERDVEGRFGLNLEGCEIRARILP